jgi:hypothetical protein
VEKNNYRPMASYVVASLEGYLESLERLKRRPVRSDLVSYPECGLCASNGYLVEEIRFLRVGDAKGECLAHSNGAPIRVNRLTPCPACACSGGAMVWVLK